MQQETAEQSWTYVELYLELKARQHPFNTAWKRLSASRKIRHKSKQYRLLNANPFSPALGGNQPEIEAEKEGRYGRGITATVM